jgi:Tol biopolymer transport system component
LVRQADGTGEERDLVASPRGEHLGNWSRDDRYLLFDRRDPETGWDLWYLERSEDGSGWEEHPFLQTPNSEVVPRVSPDGRYVAYVSTASGQREVCVQPFPKGGRRVVVSSNGGTRHRWSRDGKELFYVDLNDTLMAVPVSTEGEFRAGAPTRLFRHPGLAVGSDDNSKYDVSADGQRFVLPGMVGEEPVQAAIRLVQNWFAEFRDRD